MDAEPIFRNQPVIGAGEEDYFREHLAHWNAVNAWLRTKPSLDALKKASLYEAEDKVRPEILSRLLTRVFKLEKTEALQQLMTLKK